MHKPDSAWIKASYRELMGLFILLTVLALLGLSKLAYPLMDDQAEFLIGARTMAQGGMLYRDFWNIKPPGIFLFYLAGGSLFGFDDIGMHTFELLYMLLLAVILAMALRQILGYRVAALAAFFVTGSYYVMVNEWWLTNLEQLVNFPLFLVLLSLTHASEAKTGQQLWLLLAGFASGVVFIGKPVLFLIPLALWLLFLSCNRNAGSWWRSLVYLVSGAVLPPLGLLLWFSLRNAYALLIEAFFFIPLEVARITDPWPRLPTLVVGIKWFVEKAPVLIFLAGIGMWLYWRRPRGTLLPPGASGSSVFLIRGLLVWMVAAVIAILSQVISWWDHHWLLLLCPLAIFNAIAIEALLTTPWPTSQARLVRVAILVLALLLSAPVGYELGRIAGSFGRRMAALHPDERTTYQRAFSPWYDAMYKESAFLTQPRVRQGSIFVWGSPLIYLLASREPAAAVQGWNLHLNMTEGLFERQADELERTVPCYLFLTHAPHTYYVMRSLRLRLLVQDHYTVEHTDDLGAWYRRKGASCGVDQAAHRHSGKDS